MAREFTPILEDIRKIKRDAWNGDDYNVSQEYVISIHRDDDVMSILVEEKLDWKKKISNIFSTKANIRSFFIAKLLDLVIFSSIR